MTFVKRSIEENAFLRLCGEWKASSGSSPIHISIEEYTICLLRWSWSFSVITAMLCCYIHIYFMYIFNFHNFPLSFRWWKNFQILKHKLIGPSGSDWTDLHKVSAVQTANMKLMMSPRSPVNWRLSSQLLMFRSTPEGSPHLGIRDVISG